MEHNLAVLVQNVCKNYGENKILDEFSMEVERGTIYGLLGASGCGKTTLLGCVIGRKSINSGEIWVFGKKPGSRDSGIPGPTIGYMPQEVALIPEYSVKETIFYFGRIANMKEHTIRKRFNELSRLLDLPPDKQWVKECSGGQQRRVSLAAAIVHQPELLILDEPTVGLDPILRDKIWNYFLDLVRLQGTTIIMTTHYIEECKDTNRIGFMRNGKLLAEDSPQRVLAFHQTETLEQAFLKLCLKEDREDLSLNHKNSNKSNELTWMDKPSTSSSSQSLDMGYRSSEELTQRESVKVKTFMGINGRQMYALLDKNFKQFYRNMFGLVLFGVLPISQTVFFLYGIGGEIRDLKLAIINEELSLSECQKYNRSSTAIPDIENFECRFSKLSCRFLEYLDNPMIDKVYLDSLTEAMEGILHGKHIGVLYISPNFTEYFQDRVQDLTSIDESTLEYGQLKVYLDMSNRETGGALKYKLIDLFLNFQEDIYDDCVWDRRLGALPLHQKYLFGKKSDSFLIFMIPGLIITLVFFFGATMTSHIIVSEKCEGVWERSLAAGVSTLEVTLGHLVLQGILSVFQSIAPILIIIAFGIENRGNIGHIIITTIIQGICGLTFGFWVSVESKTHAHAHILINGILYPAMLLSGLMWPTESFPTGLKIISQCLPFTLPVYVVRMMLRKGWSWWDPKIIYYQFVPIAWIIFFVLVSLLRIRNAR